MEPTAPWPLCPASGAQTVSASSRAPLRSLMPRQPPPRQPTATAQTAAVAPPRAPAAPHPTAAVRSALTAATDAATAQRMEPPAAAAAARSVRRGGRPMPRQGRHASTVTLACNSTCWMTRPARSSSRQTPWPRWARQIALCVTQPTLQPQQPSRHVCVWGGGERVTRHACVPQTCVCIMGGLGAALA